MTLHKDIYIIAYKNAKGKCFEKKIIEEMSNMVKSTDEIKAARNAYYRKYRANNKEKIKAINLRYWQKKAAALAAEQKGEAEDDKNED